PRLVVSTFCKKCGVHLSIVKRRVIASEVTRSGAGMTDAWTTEPNTASPAAVKQEAAATPISAAPPPEPAPTAADGFGAFLQSQNLPAPAAETPPTAPPVET
ncbi:MAG: hypothetical protein PSV43_15885, partial [Prosthecobacter sp.]